MCGFTAGFRIGMQAVQVCKRGGGLGGTDLWICRHEGLCARSTNAKQAIQPECKEQFELHVVWL